MDLTVAGVGLSELHWCLDLQGFVVKALARAESRDAVWLLLCKKCVQVFPVSCSASSSPLSTQRALSLWKMFEKLDCRGR